MIITNLIGYSHGSQPPWQLFAGWGRGWCGEEFGICIFVFCIQLYICVLYLVVYFCFVFSCIFAFYIQLYICIIHSMQNKKIFTAKHFDENLFLKKLTKFSYMFFSLCTCNIHVMKGKYIQAGQPLQDLSFPISNNSTAQFLSSLTPTQNLDQKSHKDTTHQVRLWSLGRGAAKLVKTVR